MKSDLAYQLSYRGIVSTEAAYINEVAWQRQPLSLKSFFGWDGAAFVSRDTVIISRAGAAFCLLWETVVVSGWLAEAGRMQACQAAGSIEQYKSGWQGRVYERFGR